MTLILVMLSTVLIDVGPADAMSLFVAPRHGPEVMAEILDHVVAPGVTLRPGVNFRTLGSALAIFLGVGAIGLAHVRDPGPERPRSSDAGPAEHTLVLDGGQTKTSLMVKLREALHSQEILVSGKPIRLRVSRGTDPVIYLQVLDEADQQALHRAFLDLRREGKVEYKPGEDTLWFLEVSPATLLPTREPVLWVPTIQATRKWWKLESAIRHQYHPKNRTQRSQGMREIVLARVAEAASDVGFAAMLVPDEKAARPVAGKILMGPMSDDIGKGFYYRAPGYGQIHVRVEEGALEQHGALGHYILWLNPSRHAEWLEKVPGTPGQRLFRHSAPALLLVIGIGLIALLATTIPGIAEAAMPLLMGLGILGVLSGGSSLHEWLKPFLRPSADATPSMEVAAKNVEQRLEHVARIAALTGLWLREGGRAGALRLSPAEISLVEGAYHTRFGRSIMEAMGTPSGGALLRELLKLRESLQVFVTSFMMHDRGDAINADADPEPTRRVSPKPPQAPRAYEVSSIDGWDDRERADDVDRWLNPRAYYYEVRAAFGPERHLHELARASVAVRNTPAAYRVLFELLRSHAGGLRGKTLLECGCGPATSVELLRALSGARRVMGADVDAVFVEYARRHGLEVVESDLQAIPGALERQEFDLTFSNRWLDALRTFEQDADGLLVRRPLNTGEQFQVLRTLFALTAPGGLSIHVTDNPMRFRPELLRSIGFEIIRYDRTHTELVLRKPQQIAVVPAGSPLINVGLLVLTIAVAALTDLSLWQFLVATVSVGLLGAVGMVGSKREDIPHSLRAVPGRDITAAVLLNIDAPLEWLRQLLLRWTRPQFRHGLSLLGSRAYLVTHDTPVNDVTKPVRWRSWASAGMPTRSTSVQVEAGHIIDLKGTGYINKRDSMQFPMWPELSAQAASQWIQYGTHLIAAATELHNALRLQEVALTVLHRPLALAMPYQLIRITALPSHGRLLPVSQYLAACREMLHSPQAYVSALREWIRGLPNPPKHVPTSLDAVIRTFLRHNPLVQVRSWIPSDIRADIVMVTPAIAQPFTTLSRHLYEAYQEEFVPVAAPRGPSVKNLEDYARLTTHVNHQAIVRMLARAAKNLGETIGITIGIGAHLRGALEDRNLVAFSWAKDFGNALIPERDEQTFDVTVAMAGVPLQLLSGHSALLNLARFLTLSDQTPLIHAPLAQFQRTVIETFSLVQQRVIDHPRQLLLHPAYVQAFRIWRDRTGHQFLHNQLDALKGLVPGVGKTRWSRLWKQWVVQQAASEPALDQQPAKRRSFVPLCMGLNLGLTWFLMSGIAPSIADAAAPVEAQELVFSVGLSQLGASVTGVWHVLEHLLASLAPLLMSLSFGAALLFVLRPGPLPGRIHDPHAPYGDGARRPERPRSAHRGRRVPQVRSRGWLPWSPWWRSRRGVSSSMRVVRSADERMWFNEGTWSDRWLPWRQARAPPQ